MVQWLNKQAHTGKVLGSHSRAFLSVLGTPVHARDPDWLKLRANSGMKTLLGCLSMSISVCLHLSLMDEIHDPKNQK